MKLKSLLIGSAAVMAAASGARAADAIVMAPAPEPVEYVRVCDVYGAGFFYIPGTETCLKIGGYIFYQTGTSNNNGVAAGDSPYLSTGYPSQSNQFDNLIRTRIDFDVRSETEWGTLRAFARLQSDYQNGSVSYKVPGNDPDLGLDETWLSIGGLRLGYAPSAFTTTVNGGASGYGSHSWGGLLYGYSERNFIQYNFTGGNGLFATVSLESDQDTGALYQDLAGNIHRNFGDYAPDVVGKIGITQGWGTAWVQVGVDTESEGTGISGSSVGGTFTDGETAYATGDVEFAIKGGVHYNIPGLTGDSLRVIGFYSSGPNAYFNSAEWAVLGSYYHQFTPTFGASIGGEYLSDVNFDRAGTPDAYVGELSLVWTPITNFEVRSELTYSKVTNVPGVGDLDGSFDGNIRLTRSF